MKFTAQRDNLIRLLARAQGIVEKKTTVAVLSHLLLEATAEGEIKLTCTDYDVVLLDRCSANVEREGKAVISGRVLYDIVKVLPSVDISIEKESGERIHVKAGTSKYELSGFDPDDFPRIQKSLDDPGISIPLADFRKMLAKTAFCMSTEEARMNLNGVFFDIRKKGDAVQFSCVSTDGHRLAKVTRSFTGLELPSEGVGIIVHRKGITEIRKIMDSEAVGEVFIGFASGEVVFKVGQAALFVREIDEDYPDYETVIPVEFEQVFTVDVAELKEGMKRVLPLADPTAQTVKLSVNPESLTLSSSNPSSGLAQSTVFCDYSGEPFTVGFNSRYLQEAVSAIESSQVLVKMTQPGAPCVVAPSTPDEAALYVLMPVDEV